jgi:hypothetical protein
LAAKVAGDRCVANGLGARAVISGVLAGLAFALCASRGLGKGARFIARGATGGGGQHTAI